MTAKVTVKDVERVAELAQLELGPEETPAMLRDLNAILDYVAELNELDTTGVAPLAQVSELSLEESGQGTLSVAGSRRRDDPGSGNRWGLLQSPQGD
jgi:aspartyl-tRNA(Asn)/glutamyl-tRNA(Gln) amidotransferase subunit C